MHARALIVLLTVAGCAHAPPPAPPPRPAPAKVEAPPLAETREDSMVVAGTLGTLTDEEMNGPFKKRWSDVSRCYMAQKLKMGYLGGKVELRLRIGAGGAPTVVHVVTPLGSLEAERCLVALARELSFGKPHGGPEAEFTYPVDFPVDATLRNWEPERGAKALGKAKRDLQACARNAPATTTGPVTMTLYVGPGGKVTSAGIGADTPVDEKLATCLCDRATKTWRLDDPLGAMAKVTFQVAR